MSTASYSCRTPSANFRTSAASPIAANPVVSGHLENSPVSTLAPAVYVNLLRGSVLIVTGMPSAVPSAVACTLLFSSASTSGVPRSRVMNMFIRL